MIVICSFCRKTVREKEPYEDKRYSHGMCVDCYERRMKQMAGISFDEYLEDFDVPVVIVDQEARLVAINTKALAILNIPSENVRGLLGGEALECVYARLVEGCGRTAHCSACTIRRLVEKTRKAKRNQVNQQVFLMKDACTFILTVTTSYVEGMVSIAISDMKPVTGEER